MEKIEEVNETIKEWIIKNYPVGKETFEDLAKQICQLFEPKHDEGRLLTENTQLIGEIAFECGTGWTEENLINIGKIIAKTAEIKDAERVELEKGVEALLVLKDAECQAHIEALIETLKVGKVDGFENEGGEPVIAIFLKPITWEKLAKYTSKGDEG